MNDFTRVLEVARKSLDSLHLKSGSILFSAASTLQRGPVYLLGFNPGGNPDLHATIGEVLDGLPSRTENAYLDERWEGESRPGQGKLQRRVAWLLEQLDLEVRDVCAANLIFVRSRNAASAGYPETADTCWPVHEAILDIVQPRLVIGYGNSSVSPYAYLRHRLGGSDETVFPSGHGSWLCRSFSDGSRTVVGLPHLSRYAVDHHPEVADWLRRLLAAGRT